MKVSIIIKDERNKSCANCVHIDTKRMIAKTLPTMFRNNINIYNIAHQLGIS